MEFVLELISKLIDGFCIGAGGVGGVVVMAPLVRKALKME